MPPRYSAARPKLAGETYARSHQQRDTDVDNSLDNGGPSSKKVKFDVRNPSMLAPDAPDEEVDVVLEADVIGKGYGAPKRGAVNIEGYDSDSENETFDARARKRTTGSVDILKQLENYDPEASSKPEDENPGNVDKNDDDDDDMFAPTNFSNTDKVGNDGDAGTKTKKSVSFMDPTSIQGAEEDSRSGGQVHLQDSGLDEETDEEKIDEEMVEAGIDEEVGRAGLKHRAPKLEAFNMNREQEEGRFDEDGNYVRQAADPGSVHDNWLAGIGKTEVRKAAEAHEKREAEQRKKRLENERILTSDLLGMLIRNLERGETTLEALARLGRSQKKVNGTKDKKVPKWRLKKKHKAASEGAMDLDADEAKKDGDPKQTRIKEAIDTLTEAADRLIGRDRPDIYDQERELLVREYRRETGEYWVDPQPVHDTKPRGEEEGMATAMWEFRWIDGRDGGQKQGPYDRSTMKAWQDAGYFAEGVEFRPADGSTDWARIANFA